MDGFVGGALDEGEDGVDEDVVVGILHERIFSDISSTSLLTCN